MNDILCRLGIHIQHHRYGFDYRRINAPYRDRWGYLGHWCQCRKHGRTAGMA